MLKNYIVIEIGCDYVIFFVFYLTKQNTLLLLLLLLLLAAERQNTRHELTLNWDEIARHTASDAALNDLLSAIQSNFDVNFLPKGGIRQYLPYRDGFYIPDGVILYNDRVVNPPQLRC